MSRRPRALVHRVTQVGVCLFCGIWFAGCAKELKHQAPKGSYYFSGPMKPKSERMKVPPPDGAGSQNATNVDQPESTAKTGGQPPR